MYKIEKNDKSLISIFLEDVYPLTVISDRYHGVYSNGEYLALPLIFYEVPKEIDGSDSDCLQFWQNEEELDYFIGKGDNPQAAIDDLKQKYEEIL